MVGLTVDNSKVVINTTAVVTIWASGSRAKRTIFGQIVFGQAFVRLSPLNLAGQKRAFRAFGQVGHFRAIRRFRAVGQARVEENS